MPKIEKVKNYLKKKFDHSNDYYYRIKLDNIELYFTAYELNKAYDRYKKHKNIIIE